MTNFAIGHLARQPAGSLLSDPWRGSSSVARSPSPSRLKARVVRTRATHGNTRNHQATVYRSPVWASAIMFPHDAVGGWMPRPRIAQRRFGDDVHRDEQGGVDRSASAIRFGAISMNMIRKSLDPRARAASTNSRSRRLMTWPRTSRPM